MNNNKTPQELGKELVESSAIAGAMKREAQSSLAVGWFTWHNMDITKIDLEEGEEKKFKYRLSIHAKQLSPWATIYDDNSNILHMFRPLETDMQTIQEANKFMEQKKLPLFDIEKYHIEDRNNYYYTSSKILKILNP